jgi:hypothetical protein
LLSSLNAFVAPDAEQGTAVHVHEHAEVHADSNCVSRASETAVKPLIRNAVVIRNGSRFSIGALESSEKAPNFPAQIDLDEPSITYYQDRLTPAQPSPANARSLTRSFVGSLAWLQTIKSFVVAINTFLFHVRIHSLSSLSHYPLLL